MFKFDRVRECNRSLTVAARNGAGCVSKRCFRITTLIAGLAAFTNAAVAQTPPQTPAQTPPAAQRPARPTPPARDPHSPGYVDAKELPDGANAPVKEDGNFILGPTHNPAPESTAQEGVPQGDVYEFTM